MHKVLKQYFTFQFGTQTYFQSHYVYRVEDGWAIVCLANELDEDTIMEQHVISNYLVEQGYRHIAVPVFTNNDTFIFPIDQQNTGYLCHVKQRYNGKQSHLAHFLSSFHTVGQQYPYSPIFLSRYGQWKENWSHITDHMDVVKNILMERDAITKWERTWIESSFYFIGIAENAIQYLQETESNHQFNQYDQPVFTTDRISPYPNQHFLLPYRLVHDHPTRDLAEFIRHIFLTRGRKGLSTVGQFLKTYEQFRPISSFGWRLLYARLLFPIHVVDYSKKILSMERIGDYEHEQLKSWIDYQTEYEYCLRTLFEEISSRMKDDTVPAVEWLAK
ncbi:hypothetical protein [Salirhabdus salicampi]|uniref:hypothetical protein n=1 Tax=Salirhabdus salicampi TaxID=476102 RepID=UPI0020C52F99|nr:hypothetical protein [Salirhabdus salicampi]MCP8617755.1 hypothetical protein [Salirhabdus salicampi]